MTCTPQSRARTAPTGLTSEEVASRLARDGPNLLPEPKRPGVLRVLAAQLTHLLALLLWVAAGLALLAGMPELAVAIVVIILLNGLFAFWQEHRADRSTQKLRALLPSATLVMRDGQPVMVDATDLVVDDLVVLEAGDRVGADLDVVSARGITLDESLVTGESGAAPATRTCSTARTRTFVARVPPRSTSSRPPRARPARWVRSSPSWTGSWTASRCGCPWSRVRSSTLPCSWPARSPSTR